MAEEQRALREQLEKFWGERLHEVRAKYDLAVAYSRQVLAEQKTSPYVPPDGSFAIHTALAQESAAQSEYVRVLKIFTDLTIRGKIPGKDIGI